MLNPILTHGGRLIDLAAPQSSDIAIADIALALSRMPRFCGHTRRPWTGADHSMLVLQLLGDDAPTDLRIAALLHDGHEAYIGDISTPLQRELGRRSSAAPSAYAVLQDIKRDLDHAIADAFGFWAGLFAHSAIKAADLLALAIEAKLLMPAVAAAWPNLPALPATLPDLPHREPSEAYDDFLCAAFGLLGPHRATLYPKDATPC
jgi:hypothetical protein